MKVFQIFLKVFIGLVVAVLIGFSFLPSEYNLEGSIEIDAPVEKVYTLIGDLEQWEQWHPFKDNDEKTRIVFIDAPSGEGAIQAWSSKIEGRGRMEFLSVRPNEHIGYEMKNTKYAFKSSGDIKFEPIQGGVKVTWTNTSNAGWNPIWKYALRSFEADIDEYFALAMENIKRVAERS